MVEPPPLVIIATTLSESGSSGVQTHFNALRDHLRIRNQASVLVTPFDAPKWLVYPFFALRRIIDPVSNAASVWWYRHWHAVFLRMALKKVLANHAAAVIYAQCPLAAGAALSLRKAAGQTVVMVVHFNFSQADEWCDMRNIERDGRLARRIRQFESDTLPLLDGIVHVSNYMQQHLESRIPAIRTVPHAVIPNFCAPGTLADPPLDPVDIISVGTLEPRKNQRFLLEVLASARRSGRLYSLALVGHGQDRMMLERYVQDLGIEEQVRFLGFKPNAIQLMSSAKVYAHAARLENLPLALIEAMSAGLPLLAPAVGGIPELLTHGENGFFWDLDDPDEAAEYLIRILDDERTRKSLGDRSRARFDARFDSSRVADALYDFITRHEAGPVRELAARIG